MARRLDELLIVGVTTKHDRAIPHFVVVQRAITTEQSYVIGRRRNRRGIRRARSQGVAGRSDRARSSSGGAACIAQVRVPCGARRPCLPAVPRDAVLGIRVGGTLCMPPLAIATTSYS